MNITFESAGGKGSVANLFSFNSFGIDRGIFLLLINHFQLDCVEPKPLQLVNRVQEDRNIAKVLANWVILPDGKSKDSRAISVTDS